MVLIVALVTITAVVFVEQAQRRIPVQYAKRMVGNKLFYGGASTYPAPSRSTWPASSR